MAENQESNEFDEKDKVGILFHEYETLRQEIFLRTTHMFQLVAAGTGLIGWFLTTSNWGRFILATAIVLTVVVIVWHGINRDIGKAAGRLRELEANINKRAGETLLEWETRYGGAVTGYFGLARPLPPRTSNLSTQIVPPPSSPE